MKTTVISHTIRSVKELEVDLNVCSILKSERIAWDLTWTVEIEFQDFWIETEWASEYIELY